MSFPRQAPPQIPPGMATGELPWVNRQSTIMGVCIALMVALAVTTAFRLWTRLVVLKKPWWDDLFVVIAFLSFLGISIALCIDTTFGLGHHIFLVQPQNLTSILKCLYIIGVCYHISTAAIKVSLLFQYLLVFERGTLVYRITQGLLVVCSLWGFTFIFLQAFSCLPHPSYYWSPLLSKGCYGFGSKNVDMVVRCIQGQAASNFFLDLCVLALAVRLQFEANVQSNRRAMAAILFIGLLSCSFALWRLIEVAKGAGFKTDPTYHQPASGLLSVVELYFATTCATLPFFWPVIVDGWNKIFVSHEFQITETNVAEEELELSNNGSLPGRESASGKSHPQTHTTAPSYSDFSFSDEFAGYGAKKSRGNTTTVKGRQ